eukprot:CAMPEP_0119107504 /NCGR_PEP_ID=MMETSP1180-20130426/10607_1 /TAXON_ID=3052 ORGANISM="Chlamydomonas cf sp, Strain CCMP681" /NCGR_SAMPLE_ID=MMETSP1180 /ASSEMBLY_ACC=CAM_ASM_000741 /LENGTH=135 /DNA_ID=CAMNT_0007093005 /DNA_START=167 /DNA_END=574 /DNA_ORIENTATION=+
MSDLISVRRDKEKLDDAIEGLTSDIRAAVIAITDATAADDKDFAKENWRSLDRRLVIMDAQRCKLQALLAPVKKKRRLPRITKDDIQESDQDVCNSTPTQIVLGAMVGFFAEGWQELASLVQKPPASQLRMKKAQ